MFEPEYQDMDCPKCLRRRVYFDREIGFYCMSCGQEFASENMLMLLEKLTLTPRPPHKPAKSEIEPIAEIRELPPRTPKKAIRVSRKVSEPKKSEQ